MKTFHAVIGLAIALLIQIDVGATTYPLTVFPSPWGATGIAAAGSNTCVTTTAGGVKCWGSNTFGQLGDGTLIDSRTPVDVSGLSNGIAAISTGLYHSCAITKAGGAKCWGYNGLGELGDGTDIDRLMPVDVVGLSSGVASIASGNQHTCALTTIGGVKCWGTSYFGQLGGGNNISRLKPTDVLGITSGAKSVAAGGAHSCAVTSAGGAKCWGNGQYGQLGNGQVGDSAYPLDVSGLASGVAAVGAGYLHSCALTTVGGVKCWGSNVFGRLGDGTTIERLTPVDVLGLASGVAAISVAEWHTCALTTAGRVKCWGYNEDGRLGDGTTTNRSAPVDVSGPARVTTAMAAGTGHTCDLASTGGVKCWGYNLRGQLGDGTATQRLTPVDVSGLAGTGGSVTSSPPGINCGPNCAAPIDSGTVVTLISTPKPDYRFIGWSGGCSGTGACTVTMDGAKSVTATFALAPFIGPNAPGTGTVASNPYGTLSVSGATLTGNTISNFTTDSVIKLGTVPGVPAQAAEIDFQGLNLGPGNKLTVQSGANGQVLFLVNTDSNGSTLAGALTAQGGNGAAPPVIYLRSPNGIKVVVGGSITAAAGLGIDSLGSSWTLGQSLVNNGIVDGGSNLELIASKITGGGAFKGDSIAIRTFGNANNPVNGTFFLSNGLQLHPSNDDEVKLTLNGYSNSPQVFNLFVNGNATVWMPSAWPAGYAVPVNNAVVLPGGSRPAGVAEPAYGGGSMILQATGTMTLFNGGTNDFVFPGAIVLKSLGSLNLNGVVVDQGWTTSGQAFQGIFFESPAIVSPNGSIQVYGNDLNWINFSTFPQAHVRAFSLKRNSDSSASFAATDSVTPHLNTFSVIQSVAAAGGCWTCLVNTLPVNMFGAQRSRLSMK